MPKGRGSKKRKRRRKASPSVSRPRADVGDLLEAIQAIETASEFSQLVARRPDLIGDSVLAELEGMDNHPGLEGSGRLFIDLVWRARSDPQAAWSEYSEKHDRALARGDELEGVEARIKEAIMAGRFADAEDLASEAFTHAEEYGLALFRAVLHEESANAYLETAYGDLARNIERSLEHGAEAMKFAVDDEHFAKLSANQGVRLLARKSGDPAQNLEDANALLREAKRRLARAGLSETLSRTQTNLAFNVQMRQRGDRVENLRESVSLCEEALRFRSLERDAANWAYTQLNLASAYDDLTEMGEAELALAIDPLEKVIAEAARVNEAKLIGHAHGSLGGVHRRAAERLAREERATIGPEPGPSPSAAEQHHLREGREHLETALGILDPHAQREIYGRTLADLGTVLKESGDEEAAIERLREALVVLEGNVRPQSVQSAGWSLGDLLTRREDWSGAAGAFSAAVAAYDLTFYARLETSDRLRETKAMGNCARWASYALAAAGDVRGAILTLESGRTRELRRRLGLQIEDARADELPEEVAARYRESLQLLADSPIGPDSDSAGIRLQQSLSEIRALEGFEDFGSRARWEEVSAAAKAEWPIVYVNPTPNGTVLLSVSHDERGEAVGAQFLEMTSHDVFVALMFGGVPDPDDPVSYLLGLNSPDQTVFVRALDDVLSSLGEGIARGLSNLLEEVGAEGVTLIPCGPIALAPLHGAAWSDGASGTRSLIDRFEVRYSPSAIVQAACFRRRRERAGRPPVFVAIANPDVGDPLWDLPGAEAEVDELVDLLADATCHVAKREEANRAFFSAYAPSATVLHLACHGRGGLFDPEQIGVRLADGWISGAEFTAHDIQAELAILSACQTAVSAISETPDEVASLSTMLLAAGCASAIATQWSVDDAATALLMCKVYEEILAGRTAASALRKGQVWLRDLTDEQEADFLAVRPSLAAEFRRRENQGRRPGFRGVARDRGSGGDAAGRYSHPQYWAPFVAAGAA